LQKKAPKIKKQYIGNGTHFTQTKYWTVFYRENEINIGDTILIKGTTTGEQQLSLPEMQMT
jgi:UPF0176 protein